MIEAKAQAQYPREYIDTPGALLKLCAHLQDSAWIALDTEFMREKTYFPQLCLIQAANEKVVACIDPLRIDDLSPLFDLLYQERIVKVLHAAQQDLEIFYHLNDGVPKPLFDTQIAASLLGYGDQVSYAGLVQNMLGIELGKTQTRTDWSQRPLAAEQLNYAADDVYYLGQVYLRLRSELTRRGRLDWLAEDFAALADAERYYTHPETAWLRIRGYARLRGVKLATLSALAAWREREAVSSDKPRRWIVGDEVLLDLARRMPDSLEVLSKVRGLNTAKINRYGGTLLATIAAARAMPRKNWPQLPDQVVTKPEQEPLLDALQAIIRLVAMRHEISPANLAGRRELEKLLSGSDIALMHGWRAAIAGNEVKAFLAGQTQLAMQKGMLQLVR